MEPKKRKHAGVLASCACSESVRRYCSGSHSLLCFAHARHVLSPSGRELERGRVISHSRKISTAPRAKFRDKALTLVEVLIVIISDVKQTFCFRDDSVSRRQERVRENKMFAFAFTLAEVLIVLGIIGLIADMTIPTLHQNISDKTTVTRLKKMYSTLESAYQLAVIDEGTPDNWALGVQGNAQGAANVIKIFTKYLKNLSTEGDKSEGEWSTSGISLVDGTQFSVYVLNNDCELNFGVGKNLEHICAYMYIDINGADKKPNMYGYDNFLFYLSKYGIVPAGTTNEVAQYSFETHCKANFIKNFGCTAWVLYNENVDYQRCKDLSWNGKTKCK